MEELKLDSFSSEDFAEYKELMEKGILGLFIYNKNFYFNGERHQIDPHNYKVRTELRSNKVVAPLSVFKVFNGCNYGKDYISVGELCVEFNVGDSKFAVNGIEKEFEISPFEYLDTIYVSVTEVSEVLGLACYSCYKDRLLLIGEKESILNIQEAIKLNSKLEEVGAREVVGYYDAFKFTHEDFVLAKDNWRKFLCATPETIDTNDKILMKRIKASADNARKLVKEMNRGDDIVILWGQNPPSVTDDIMNQYANIRALALAWGTFGSDLYHNDSLKADILFGLKWMNEHMYGDAEIEGRGWRDINAFNWWHWYVGGPEMLTDAILIMENELSREEVCRYMRPFKWLLDNWRLKYCQDQCSGRMAVGTKCALIMEDPERLTISSNDYHIMLDIVLEGPGTHTDYCNYQHNFPYNMVYGQSNLHRVLRVGSILAGTPLEFVSPRKYNQYMLFKYMFEAAMYRGRGYTCFLGRASIHSEQNNGLEVLVYIMPMIGNYGPEEDSEIKHFIKYSVSDPQKSEDLKNNCYISHYSKITDILNDEAISSENDYTCAHAWFSADRATQHRNDYAFALSMPSYRHVTYECINHENHTGWYMNEGTLYLYTNNDKYAFDGVNFVLNKRLAQKMPGTTVDLRPRPEVSISEGVFGTTGKVGCMDFDKKYIVAGMDYAGYSRDVGEDDYVDTGYGGGKPKFPNDLVARKAYFMFDDECVCLGTGINSTMDSDVVTTVEHRRLVKTENDPIGEDVITVNGSVMPHCAFESSFENPKYARVEGFAGFVFTEVNKVSVSKYLYSMNQDEIKDPITIPDYAKKERPFLEIFIDHGKNPVDASYVYAILPYASEEKTAKYAENPDFEVISNTKDCQAVREKTLGVTGIVFYEAGECAGIKVDKACIVTFSENNNELKIKVCEPTNKEETVTVEINRELNLISADNRYTVEKTKITKLVLDVKDSIGEGYEAIFSI